MKTKGIELQIQNNPKQSQGLDLKNSRKVIPDDTRYIPEPYKNVASGMEQEFAKYMIEQMEKTVDRGTPDNQATSYYRSLTTQERSKAMAETGRGLGLKKLILDQIYPKHLRTELGYNSFEAQMKAQAANRNKIKIYESEQQNGVKGIEMAPVSQEGDVK